MSPDTLIGAVLRGEAVTWPRDAALEEFWREASRHGMLGPLYDVTAGRDDVPEELSSRLRAYAAAEVVRQEVRGPELQQVVDALASAAVRALLFKGAHLGLTCYRHAWLRPRNDIDLLIRKNDRDATERALRSIGYEPLLQNSGALLTQQMHLAKPGALGVRHMVDVHWRVLNPHAFAHAFAFEELDRHALEVPAAGAPPRVPCDVHAILLACAHRVAHHRGERPLIWTYDVHLLASRLGADGLWHAAGLASAKRLAAVYCDGLEQAARYFGTPVPAPLFTYLRAAARSGEKTAEYLQQSRRPIQDLAMELRGVPTVRGRLRLLREHLLPASDYMLQAFGARTRLALPLLYVRRLIGGVPKWLSQAR